VLNSTNIASLPSVGLCARDDLPIAGLIYIVPRSMPRRVPVEIATKAHPATSSGASLLIGQHLCQPARPCFSRFSPD